MSAKPELLKFGNSQLYSHEGGVDVRLTWLSHHGLPAHLVALFYGIWGCVLLAVGYEGPPRSTIIHHTWGLRQLRALGGRPRSIALKQGPQQSFIIQNSPLLEPYAGRALSGGSYDDEARLLCLVFVAHL